MRILQVTATLLAAGLIGCSIPVTAGAQTACDTLGGAVDEDRFCQVHTETPTYMLDMAFPVGYPDQQALTDYLTQTRDGFVNVSEMPGSRNLPYALDARATEYGSGNASNGTRSVVFEVYQNVGGAHPTTWYQAFNYDLAAQTPITYESLFGPDAEALEVIYPVVQRELQRLTGIDQPILPEDGLNPANYQNFALTDDAVIFFFSQGELLPHAAGVTQASVPRSELANLLAV
ncbi:esterase [Mycolicibacterium thermoresistibile]